jgi:hypothetical protein
MNKQDCTWRLVDMWRWILLVFVLLLVGCSSGIVQELEEEPQAQVTDDDPPVDTVQTGSMPTLTNLGQAPELTNDVWLNSAEPLRLAGLRGKVVLLEMWTFG